MKEAFLILLSLSFIMAVVVVIVIIKHIRKPPIYEGMTKGMDESLDNFDDAIDWDCEPYKN